MHDGRPARCRIEGEVGKRSVSDDSVLDVALAASGLEPEALSESGWVTLWVAQDSLRWEPATLERWEALGSAVEPAAASAAASELREAEPLPLGWWILMILVVLIIVESWVGNWHLRVQRGIAA